LAKKKKIHRAFLSRKNISQINWWNQSSNEYNHENISFLKLLWRIVNSSQFRKFQAHSVWGSRNALSRNKFSFSTMAYLAEYKINDNSSNARIFLLRTRRLMVYSGATYIEISSISSISSALHRFIDCCIINLSNFDKLYYQIIYRIYWKSSISCKLCYDISEKRREKINCEWQSVIIVKDIRSYDTR